MNDKQVSCKGCPSNSKTSTSTPCPNVYEKQLAKEPVLPIDDIQGDTILGFNKAYNLELVLNIKNKSPDATTAVKQWISDKVKPKITSCADVLDHRKQYSGRYGDAPNPAFVNVSFSFQSLKKLLKDTEYELSLNEFDQNSAFVIGVSQRAGFLGDDRKIWQFGNEVNNDILINIASDFEDRINQMKCDLLQSTDEFITVAHEVFSFRGEKNFDLLYGHEHFGFQDGLSQPEVRGTYFDAEANSKKFIVRRLVSPDDPRFPEYSRPGFRLLDAGHFLLGNQIADIDDPGMQNPNANNYRTMEEKYPSWCSNGSYTVYRKLEQDVPAFWSFALESAQKLNNDKDLLLDDDGLKDLAGQIASKMVGRWWDGTPLIFNEPLSGLYYPPPLKGVGEDEKKRIIKMKDKKHQGLNGLKNGFQYENPEQGWLVSRNGKVHSVAPPGMSEYPADPDGIRCPFAGHIRKIVSKSSVLNSSLLETFSTPINTTSDIFHSHC